MKLEKQTGIVSGRALDNKNFEINLVNSFSGSANIYNSFLNKNYFNKTNKIMIHLICYIPNVKYF